MASISSEQAIMHNGYQLIPEEFSTLAYETVFKDSSIYTGYAVSIFVTVVGTCMALVLCGMAGYAMSLQRVKYRNAVSMYFYIWALILPALVSPFNVFLMRNYFKTIPSSLVESAEIDGSGPIRTFFRIVIPLATPIIATVALFIGLGYWNDWANALWFISDRKLFPLQYMLYRIKSIMDFIRQNGTMGNIQLPSQTFQLATLFVTIGPIVLLYPFVQRFFVIFCVL